MADIRVRPDRSMPGAGAQTDYVPVASMLDGVVFDANWLAKMALDGRMVTFLGGTRSSPITGAGVYVATTPDLDVNIPANTLVMPVYLSVNYETVGTSGIQECFALCGNGGTFATGGTTVTPVNARPDAQNVFGMSCQSPASSAVIPTIGVNEFFRNSPPMGITKSSESATVSSIDPYRMEWSALATGEWPICYNPAGISQIMVWMGGQAPTGFIKLTVVVPPLTAAS